MEGVAGATNKELRVSDGREMVSAPETKSPDRIGTNVPIYRKAQADSYKEVLWVNKFH